MVDVFEGISLLLWSRVNLDLDIVDILPTIPHLGKVVFECPIFYIFVNTYLHWFWNALQAAMYGMAQSIPDSRLIEEIAENFVDVLYTTK